MTDALAELQRAQQALTRLLMDPTADKQALAQAAWAVLAAARWAKREAGD